MSESCPKCKGKGGTEYYTDTTVRCYECQGTGIVASPTDSIDQIITDYGWFMQRTSPESAEAVSRHYKDTKAAIESIIRAARAEGNAEGLRNGKFLQKNRDNISMRAMLAEYPTDAPEYEYVKSWFERHLALNNIGDK